MFSGFPTVKFQIFFNVHLFCIILQEKIDSGVYHKEGTVRLVLKRLP